MDNAACECLECGSPHCAPTSTCEYECCNHEPMHWGYRFGFELAAIALHATGYKKAVERLHALPFVMLGKVA